MNENDQPVETILEFAQRRCLRGAYFCITLLVVATIALLLFKVTPLYYIGLSPLLFVTIILLKNAKRHGKIDKEARKSWENFKEKHPEILDSLKEKERK